MGFQRSQNHCLLISWIRTRYELMVGWGELGETARTYTQYYRGQEPVTVTMFGGSGANMKCFQTVSLNPDGYGVTS